MGRYAETEKSQRSSILLNRKYHWPWAALAASQVAQGRIKDATNSIREVLKLHPETTLEDYRIALTTARADKGASILAYMEVAWPKDSADKDSNK